MTVAYRTRRQWGANDADLQAVGASKRTEFFVHYDGANPITRKGDAIPRAIEAGHRARGFKTIGYNFVVDQDGNVYEGRGWNAIGAHCPGHNTSGWGVQVAIGGDQEPSAAALSKVRELYEEACQRAGRTLSKKGHRDGKATSCPGGKLYAWVKLGMPAPTGVPIAPVPQPPAAPKPDPNAAAPRNYTGRSAMLDEDGDHGSATQSRLEESLIWTGGSLSLTGKIEVVRFGGLRHPVMAEATERALQLRLNHIAVENHRSFRKDGKPGLVCDGDFKKLSTQALQWAVGESPDGDWGSQAIEGLQYTLNRREL